MTPLPKTTTRTPSRASRTTRPRRAATPPDDGDAPAAEDAPADAGGEAAERQTRPWSRT